MKFWPFRRNKVVVPESPASTELPIPMHLKRFFVPQMDKRNEAQITGEIRCTCGCMAFSAHRRKDGDGYYHLTCADCGGDVLLFDVRQHGWDTVVCHMQHDDELNGETTEVCTQCGSERFGVTVWIEPTQKEEFISCVEGELPDDEWVNAFTWFAAHLTCSACGCKQRSWADIETA